MKVSELIDILEELPSDAVVVLSHDAEGNLYTPVASYGTAIYVPDSTYSGQIYLSELDDEAVKNGYTEDDVWEREEGDGSEEAVILWPTV